MPREDLEAKNYAVPQMFVEDHEYSTFAHDVLSAHKNHSKNCAHLFLTQSVTLPARKQECLDQSIKR